MIIFLKFDPVDIKLLCESLWHSVQRGDIPDDERARMSAILEKLNSTRIEKTSVVIATKDLSIREHVQLSENHAQRALDLSYEDEPQSFWVRRAIGRAQSILISLIVNGKLR